MRDNEVSELFNRNIYCERSQPFSFFNMRNMHYHDHYELYYLISGKRKYFVDNQIYNLSKGDIILIPKNVLHKTIIADNQPHERLLINFNDNLLFPEHYEEIENCFGKYYYHIPSTMIGHIEMLLFKIENEYKINDVFKENIIRGLLLEFFAFLIRYSEKIPSEQSQAKSDRLIQEIAEYLSENFDKDISLISVSKLFHISQEHLSRKFKKVTGLGFGEYLTLTRVKQSEELLKAKKYSITEIAFLCGFNSSNYFSTAFKKVTGVSPIKYRKLWGGTSS